MAYQDVILAMGPRHYWRMNGTSGVITDLGTGASDMTVTGATRDVASPILDADDDGQCSFDGSDDFAVAALSMQSATEATYIGIATVGSYSTDDRMGFEVSSNPNSNAGISLDLGNSTGGESGTVSLRVTGSGGGNAARRTFPQSEIPTGTQVPVAFRVGTDGTIEVFIAGQQVSTVLRDGGTPGGVFPDTDVYLASRAGANLFCPIAWDEFGVFTRYLDDDEIAAAHLVVAAGPGTLYVDADHPDASDTLVPPFANLRAQALDPDSPLLTIQAGVNVVVSEDTIQVAKATAVYAGYTATNEETSATDVTILGPDSDDPDDWYSLERWTWVDRVRWSQRKFISDGTPGEAPRMYRTVCDDSVVTISQWWAKQGGPEILHWTGHFQVDDPIIQAPWDSDYAGAYMTGAGFRLGSQYTLDSFHADDMTIRRPQFIDVGGEDAINIAALGNDSHTGTIRVEGAYFESVRQAVGATAHSDCIASAGCDRLEIIRPRFGPNCESFVIASDGYINQLVMESGLSEGNDISGFSIQLSGIRDLRLVHVTADKGRFGDVRIFNNNNPVEDPVRLIANNIIRKLDIDDGSSHSPAEQYGNLILVGPRTTADLPGFPEFGTSADTSYELANSGYTSPGINQGMTIPDPPTTDRLGRAIIGIPDVGCHESNPAVPVIPDPRGPYLLSTTPTGGATNAAQNASVTATLFPKPGETLDETTVTTSSAYLTDPTGTAIPAQVTIDPPDEDGYQLVTVNPKYQITPTVSEGLLYPLVVYTAHLTAAIEDTEGSALTAASWAFRIQGPAGPAISRLASGMVALRSVRTASLSVPSSSAEFTQPSPGAGFEQAEAEIIR